MDAEDTTDEIRNVTIDAQDDGPRLCTSCNDHFHEILAELVDERVANQQVSLRLGPYGQHAHFINHNNNSTILEPPPQYDERPPTYEECIRS